MSFFGACVESEECHAGSNGKDDEVFVERVAFLEERDVEKHNREQFT